MSRHLADEWFAAFREKDISKLKLAEDFVHNSPFGEIKGKDVYLDLIRQNEEAFFSPKLEIQDVIESGDRIAVRYLVDGNPACDCLYVREGEIAEIHSYYHVGEKPSF